jgi:hypothetical protein
VRITQDYLARLVTTASQPQGEILQQTSPRNTTRGDTFSLKQIRMRSCEQFKSHRMNVYHLLESLGHLLVPREAPRSKYVPLSFSSSLDSSDLHLDPPLPAVASLAEDFTPKLQRIESWLTFSNHFIHSPYCKDFTMLT